MKLIRPSINRLTKTVRSRSPSPLTKNKWEGVTRATTAPIRKSHKPTFNVTFNNFQIRNAKIIPKMILDIITITLSIFIWSREVLFALSVSDEVLVKVCRVIFFTFIKLANHSVKNENPEKSIEDRLNYYTNMNL